jgi:serine protease AprX
MTTTKSGKLPPRSTATNPSAPRTRSDEEKVRIIDNLTSTLIAVPLLRMMEKEPARSTKAYDLIIDLNLSYAEGRDAARQWVFNTIKEILAKRKPSSRSKLSLQDKRKYSPQYVFARLDAAAIRELAQRNNSDAQQQGFRQRPVFRIWPDFPLRTLIYKSIGTVKADAGRITFSAAGKNIVWAVLDSGIERDHPHFQLHKNLELNAPLSHADFSGGDQPLQDRYGHGTHVAGILCGEQLAPAGKDGANNASNKICAYNRQRDENGDIMYHPITLEKISGMAPQCKVLSLKVLNDNGEGQASNLIAALAYIQEANNHGRHLHIHGINMSLGYPYDAEWFACGQSPLCVEVNRLARSGVVVVVAAGNSGYGYVESQSLGTVASGLDLTINDPGNAELAITVGSTHREMPHVYGVSYFSSKGPTGDGRMKPDLVAPGEKILSCAAGRMREALQGKTDTSGQPVDICDYVEDSGTSMAAPHVSGVIAAFLSVRREFIGQPEQVKSLFLSTATDLKRERSFQGHGLVDLMRAIQAI